MKINPRSIGVVLFLLINILTILPADANSISLVGFWNAEFPVPSGLDGYIFLKDGTFIFYLGYFEDNMDRYNGSRGKWRIDSHKRILIKTEYDVWSKDDIMYLKKTLREWKTIGYTSSITKLDRELPFKIVLSYPYKKGKHAYYKIMSDPFKKEESRQIVEAIMSLTEKDSN